MDAGLVVGHPGPLVGDEVGRDGVHGADIFRRIARAEGGEAKDRFLVGVHAVDLGRADLRIDDQLVILGHDQHDLFAGIDDAADRVGGELVDRAGDRGDDSLLLELIVGGDLPFEELVEPRRGLGELLRRLAPRVLVDLDDLQLGPGDLGAGLGNAGDDLAKLPVELRGAAFGLGDPLRRYKVLAAQRPEAFDLVLRQRDLAVDGVFLGVQPDKLLLELVDLLAELVLLSGARQDAGFEGIGLDADDLGGLGIDLGARACSPAGRRVLWRRTRSASRRTFWASAS